MTDMATSFQVAQGQAAMRQNAQMGTLLDQAVDRFQRAEAWNANLNGQVAARDVEIVKLRQQVLDLQIELVKEKAHGEGVTAMFLDIKTACPNSPTLRDSGKRYRDGDVKSMGRLVYEAAFDRIVMENRISNPERFRAD